MEDESKVWKKAEKTFSRALAKLGLDAKCLVDCFSILAASDSKRFQILKDIPDAFEEYATLGMYVRYPSRVDQLYQRMSLRNSAKHVRLSLSSGLEIEALRRLRLRLSNKDVEDSKPTSPTAAVLTDKTFRTACKNLYRAFISAHYYSKESQTSPGMQRVIAHWKGMLDAHRVALLMAKKSAYGNE